MPDVFQQLKQKSGWGDLIDTVKHAIQDAFRKPSRYMSSMRNYRDDGEIEEDLSYLSKNKGKKISWDQFKRERYSTATPEEFEAIKKIFIEGGAGDRSGVYADKALALFVPPTPAETTAPPAAPSATGAPSAPGAPSATPEPTPAAAGTPASLANQVLAKINEQYQASGKSWISYADALAISPTVVKNVLPKVRRQLQARGKDLFNNKKQKRYYIIKKPRTSAVSDPWMSSLIEGETARLFFMHRASLIAPKSVTSPLNEV